MKKRKLSFDDLETVINYAPNVSKFGRATNTLVNNIKTYRSPEYKEAVRKAEKIENLARGIIYMAGVACLIEIIITIVWCITGNDVFLRLIGL